jgi:hypothetical protein
VKPPIGVGQTLNYAEREYVYKKDIPVRRQLCRSPKVRLEVENGFFLQSVILMTILNGGSRNYETKMAAKGRDPAVTVGVVGAPSSGIELVLKQISLPVAQN